MYMWVYFVKLHILQIKQAYWYVHAHTVPLSQERTLLFSVHHIVSL